MVTFYKWGVIYTLGSAHGPSRGLLNPRNWKKSSKSIQTPLVCVLHTLTDIPCHCQLTGSAAASPTTTSLTTNDGPSSTHNVTISSNNSSSRKGDSGNSSSSMRLEMRRLEPMVCFSFFLFIQILLLYQLTSLQILLARYATETSATTKTGPSAKLYIT